MGFNPFLKVVWPVFGHKTHLKMGQNHQKTWSFQKVDENGSGKWVKTLFWAQNQLKNGSSSISAIHREPFNGARLKVTVNLERALRNISPHCRQGPHRLSSFKSTTKLATIIS